MAPNDRDHSNVIRISPYHYVHVLNLNTNVTRLVLGPRTFVCMQDEKVVVGPEKMISLAPTQFCVIANPVVKGASGEPMLDPSGQVKLKLGDKVYRFHEDPFPLYPGEMLEGRIETLPVVAPNTALRLRALLDFTDTDGQERIVGEEWLFEGPATFYPRKEIEILKTEQAIVIEINTALCIRATKDCTDRSGKQRVFGEMWLIRTPGIYLPGAYESLVETRTAFNITDKVALHVKAIEAHVDEFGRNHRRGDEWLITSEDTDSYICSVHEEIVGPVEITVLNSHQYCIILNPVDDRGVPQLGGKKLVQGEKSFFLKPGETLRNGVEDSFVLQHDEGLILRAEERFMDEVLVEMPAKADSDEPAFKKQCIVRRPGDQWMIRGPIEYVPPIQVEVIQRRKAIPLDRNEGIYVRNTRTGSVRAVIGEAYMLNQEEELWTKRLPQDVVQMLSENRDPLGDRGLYATKHIPTATEESLDLTKVVTFQVPHNAAVQIYDYRDKRARVEFGPTLVMLGPEEQFTKLSLSGGKPKRPNMIKSLCLLLGPDFCTDVVVVETADHARLSLQLSYNWKFEVPDTCSQDEAAKLFAVPDFVGDVCKAIASRVRGTVAAVKFDDFHKNSARIIRSSVFGLDENNKVRDRFVFSQNNLHITSIDVQSVEPVDQRTRDALQKSVQLAIEITTNSQEAAARHEAERLEQEARGRLERQKIEDEAAAEEVRRTLLETRVQLAALESTGQATAEAQSRAEAARIEGQSAVELARLRAEASEIETDAELERLRKAREAELEFMRQKDLLKVTQLNEEMKVDVARFTSMVSAIGPDNLRQIAKAVPENNLRMLSALGLQSTLITDGTTPVNLLSTAHGLIGQLARPASDTGRELVVRHGDTKTSVDEDEAA
ncbi:major vault protein isoform X1 [Fasciola gigantica]|uniref:Major vault protein n=1 Tax=Fasciola gigantica TaxID=46835 RepID=A0A504Y9P3_FASGI|nr:major vault protein isoform X1 [Fasciola gigantica]